MNDNDQSHTPYDHATHTLYFSVVVPFYNKAHSLKACINSLLSQNFPVDRYEILMVNNNSTDTSCAIVQSYGAKLMLLHEPKQNAYAARNTGITHAHGRYIVFTDADSIVPTSWLATIHKICEHQHYDILLGWYLPVRHIPSLALHATLVSERIQHAIATKNYGLLTACAANFTISAHVFRQENLFIDTANSEDVHFVLRCIRKGYSVGFSDMITVTRKDITSWRVALLKNFIYGCATARDIGEKQNVRQSIHYAWRACQLACKHLPEGIGLIILMTAYIVGYCIFKLRLASPDKVGSWLASYTRFMSKTHR